MPWIIGGATVLTGLMGSSSASKAASGQTRAAEMATEEQRRQFDLTRRDQQPFLDTGTAANIRLRDMLGLGGGAGTTSGGKTFDQIVSELRASGQFATPAQFAQEMPYDFDGQGRDMRRQVSPAGVDESALMAEAQRIFGQQQAQASPGSGGELMDDFTGEDLTSEPGYQFALREGNKAIENAARARGMSLSPSTVKELLRYGTDYAGTKYGEAFNRNMSNRTTKFNFLTGTSGGGQTAANTVATAGTNMANNVGQLVTGAANARGAAGIAGSNAWSNAIGQGVNMWNQNNMLKRILHPGGGFTGVGGNPY